MTRGPHITRWLVRLPTGQQDPRTGEPAFEHSWPCSRPREEHRVQIGVSKQQACLSGLRRLSWRSRPAWPNVPCLRAANVSRTEMTTFASCCGVGASRHASGCSLQSVFGRSRRGDQAVIGRLLMASAWLSPARRPISGLTLHELHLLCRPVSSHEISSHAPQVVVCEERDKKVTICQNVGGKQQDRTFRFDMVRPAANLAILARQHHEKMDAAPGLMYKCMDTPPVACSLRCDWSVAVMRCED